MITIFLDRASSLPLYEQVCRRIRAAVESGELAAGERMPSKRELARHLEASPITIGTAYAQLVAEGYLEARLRSGHFVLPVVAAPVGRRTPTVLEPVLPHYRFNLTTAAFDASLFPFTVWARLVRQVLSGPTAELLASGHPQGLPALREAIADHLSRFRGIACDPSRIVVGAGSEYLTLLLVMLLGRKNRYAVEDPGYPKIARIVTTGGGRVVRVPLDGAGLDVLRLAASGARVAHVTPSHQFPTGVVMPVGRRRELLAWAAQQPDRYVIEDDYDSEFRHAGQPIPALYALDRSERVVYMNSFAKSLAPSLRISYMVLPPALLTRFRATLGHHACTVSNIEQATLARFLAEERFERHLARVRNAARLRRDAFLQALRATPLAARLSIRSEAAGLHLLLEVAGGDETDLTMRAAAVGIRVIGLSAYGGRTFEDVGKAVFVLGYAGVSEADAATAGTLLGNVWTN